MGGAPFFMTEGSTLSNSFNVPRFFPSSAAVVTAALAARAPAANPTAPRAVRRVISCSLILRFSALPKPSSVRSGGSRRPESVTHFPTTGHSPARMSDDHTRIRVGTGILAAGLVAAPGSRKTAPMLAVGKKTRLKCHLHPCKASVSKELQGLAATLPHPPAPHRLDPLSILVPTTAPRAP